jgi:hypothetical protein
LPKKAVGLQHLHGIGWPVPTRQQLTSIASSRVRSLATCWRRRWSDTGSSSTQDRQVARPHRAAPAGGPCRRGDPVATGCDLRTQVSPTLSRMLRRARGFRSGSRSADWGQRSGGGSTPRQRTRRVASGSGQKPPTALQNIEQEGLVYHHLYRACAAGYRGANSLGIAAQEW